MSLAKHSRSLYFRTTNLTLFRMSDFREISTQMEATQDSFLMDSPSALMDSSQMYPDEAYLSEIDVNDESNDTDLGQDGSNFGSPTPSQRYFFKKPRALPVSCDGSCGPPNGVGIH